MLCTSINPETLTEVELELTTTCNFACALCFRHHSHEAKHTATFAEVVKTLDKMPSLTDVTIAGQNSEPSLCPDLLKIIRYLKNRKINVTIYTNAEAQPVGYYRILASVLGKQGKMCFGVFGSTQELHEVYRKGSRLSTILKVYDTCQELCRCELWWILFEYNFLDYKENKNAFKSRNVVVYNTLPFREVFEYRCREDICFPKCLGLDMSSLDKTIPEKCPLEQTHQAIVDSRMNIFHCFLEKYFGEKYCYLCLSKNANYMRSKGCMGLNEFGG